MIKPTQYNISGLYVVTPDSYEVIPLCKQVEQAILGGARLVQYRNKIADTSLRLMQASSLLAMCRMYQVPLIINDHLDLMLRINADGLHLGQTDCKLSAARNLIGPDKILGASCYNQLDLALAAQAEGADYVAFGACYVSGAKPDRPHAPLSLFVESKKTLSLPVVGFGGIKLDNAPSLIHAGVDALAVTSDIFLDDDIQVVSAHYTTLYEQHRLIAIH